MSYYKDEWLSHLRESIPPEAKRNRVSLYTIALEGWRRGLKLKFYRKVDLQNKTTLIYSLESENNVHYFRESSGDANTDIAFKICRDKGLTEKYLRAANIPIPLGKTFKKSDTIKEIIKYGNDISYPLVVKPTDGSSGRGIITNIQNENELKDALKHIFNNLQFENIIVQQHIFGDEVRIYVLGNKVLAATNRIPANVTGDGHSTIIQLIEEKNKFRKKVPHLYHRPIVIDSEVKKMVNEAGYTFDSVLEEGKKLFLRKVSNISAGGDPVDFTDELTEEQKRIAIEAKQAIPGLSHCGIDMIINRQSGSGTILEVNTQPGIGSHLFPISGTAKDIPKAIIDFYFPETRNLSNLSSNVYFDLQMVFDSLNNGYLSELEIKDHPCNNLYSKRFVIRGSLGIQNYYELLKEQILKQGFNGYMKYQDRKVNIILGHEESDQMENFLSFLHGRQKQFQIIKIEVEDWEKPIKSGFELMDGLKQMSLIELENEYRQLHRDLIRHEREVRRLKNRIMLIKRSHSWKATAPIRIVKDLVRKKSE